MGRQTTAVAVEETRNDVSPDQFNSYLVLSRLVYFIHDSLERLPLLYCCISVLDFRVTAECQKVPIVGPRFAGSHTQHRPDISAVSMSVSLPDETRRAPKSVPYSIDYCADTRRIVGGEKQYRGSSSRLTVCHG